MFLLFPLPFGSHEISKHRRFLSASLQTALQPRACPTPVSYFWQGISVVFAWSSRGVVLLSTVPGCCCVTRWNTFGHSSPYFYDFVKMRTQLLDHNWTITQYPYGKALMVEVPCRPLHLHGVLTTYLRLGSMPVLLRLHLVDHLLQNSFFLLSCIRRQKKWSLCTSCENCCLTIQWLSK